MGLSNSPTIGYFEDPNEHLMVVRNNADSLKPGGLLVMGYRQTVVTMLRTMLPDLCIQIEAMVAEGDMVVSCYTTTATDTRGYMGKPPTVGPSERLQYRCSDSSTAKSSRAGRHAMILASWCSREICRQWVH